MWLVTDDVFPSKALPNLLRSVASLGLRVLFAHLETLVSLKLYINTKSGDILVVGKSIGRDQTVKHLIKKKTYLVCLFGK